jgi:hypothetical protein
LFYLLEQHLLRIILIISAIIFNILDGSDMVVVFERILWREFKQIYPNNRELLIQIDCSAPEDMPQQAPDGCLQYQTSKPILLYTTISLDTLLLLYVSYRVLSTENSQPNHAERPIMVPTNEAEG